MTEDKHFVNIPWADIVHIHYLAITQINVNIGLQIAAEKE